MALNRNEINQQVNAKITPTVFPLVHRDLLNNDIIESLFFRKEIITEVLPVGGVVDVSFADKDLATVPTTVNLTVSFTNLANGDVKYLAITKNAGNTVAFVGALDVSVRKSFIDTDKTYVIYMITVKDANISVESVNIDNDVGLAGLIGDVQKTLIIEENWWNMPALQSRFRTYPPGVTLDNFVSAEIIIISRFNSKKYPLCEGSDPDGLLGAGGGYRASSTGLTLHRGDVDSAFTENLFSVTDAFIFIKYAP